MREQQKKAHSKEAVTNGEVHAEAGTPPKGLWPWRTHMGEEDINKEERRVRRKGEAKTNHYILTSTFRTSCHLSTGTEGDLQR